MAVRRSEVVAITVEQAGEAGEVITKGQMEEISGSSTQWAPLLVPTAGMRRPQEDLLT